MVSPALRLPPKTGLAAAGLLTVGVCALPYLHPVRNWRYARLPLPEQVRTLHQHQDDPLFLYHLGRKLNAARQFPQALTVLDRAVGLDPHTARLRDEWAKAQMGTGRVSDAFGQLKQFAGTHPQAPEAPLLLGKFYVTQGAFTPARRELEEAVKRAPASAEAWSLLAHVRIKMGNNAQALAELEKALALRPDAADDHLQRAVLLSPNDPAQARRAYERAVTLAPASAEARRQYALFLLNRGELPAARTQAEAACARDPNDAMAWLVLGRSLANQGLSADAIAPLTQAARLAPLDPNPADSLRRAYRLAGDGRRAAQWQDRFLVLRRSAEERRQLREATLARPGDRETHRRYALALCRIGDVNGAVQQFALATRTRPDHPKALVAASRALGAAGFGADALALARQAQAATRLNPEVEEVLGDALAGMGHLHEAAIHYEKIRDLRQDRLPLYRQRIAQAAARLQRSDAPAEKLLRLAQRTSDPDRAQALLSEALQRDPQNTRCVRLLLRLQFRRGQTAAAEASANRLAQLSPEDGVSRSLRALLRLGRLGERMPTAEEARAIEADLKGAEDDATVASTIYYGRGLLALRRQQPKEAVQALKIAARLDPDSPAVYQRLAEACAAAGDPAGAENATAEFRRRVGGARPR